MKIIIAVLLVVCKLIFIKQHISVLSINENISKHGIENLSLFLLIVNNLTSFLSN